MNSNNKTKPKPSKPVIPINQVSITKEKDGYLVMNEVVHRKMSSKEGTYE